MIKAIVIYERNSCGIGLIYNLPWFKIINFDYFEDVTGDSPIVMGYNTMVVLRDPIPGHANIVIIDEDTNFSKLHSGFIYCFVDDCINFVKKMAKKDTVWIIGGSKTFDLFEDVIDEWNITSFEGPNYFSDNYFRLDLKRFDIDEDKTRHLKEKYETKNNIFKFERKVYDRRQPLKYIPFSLVPMNFHHIEARHTSLYFHEFYNLFGAICNFICLRHPNNSKYHNCEHLVKCGFLMFSLYNHFNNTGEETTFRKSIILTTAMLFHDYFHLNEKDDIKNIDQSVESFLEVFKSNPELFDPFGGLSREEAERVCQCIKATMYDFDNPFPTPPLGKLKAEYFSWVRDIDQLYVPAYFNSEIFNELYEDIGKRLGYSYEDFVERNIDYYQKLNFYTDEIRGIFDGIIEDVKLAHKYLIE